jgi:cyclopropane fatty-acyl-phospholipid synthase-like methyltransferase
LEGKGRRLGCTEAAAEYEVTAVAVTAAEEEAAMAATAAAAEAVGKAGCLGRADMVA